MVHDMIKTACDGTSITIRHVTNIRTITDALQQIEMYTNLLSEVNKAVRMYYTFPVTSATAERSFSTDDLDLVTLVRNFVSCNSHGLSYFGSF